MRKELLFAIVLVAVGCTTAPPGARVGERLRPPGGTRNLLATYDQENWMRNAAFSRMLNEPVSGLARDLAAASELDFMGYVRPPAKEALVNAEIGPVDDMSRFYVVANVIESSSASAKRAGVKVLVENDKMVLASVGVPVYVEEMVPQLQQMPPVPEAWGPSPQPPWEQPAPQEQPSPRTQWQQPYYYPE